MNNIGRVERSKGKFLQSIGHTLINLDDLVVALSLDNNLTEEAEAEINTFLESASRIITYLGDDDEQQSTETL